MSIINIKLYKIKSIDNNWLLGIKGNLYGIDGYFIVDTGAQANMIEKSCLPEWPISYIENEEIEVVGVSPNSNVEITLADSIHIRLSKYTFDIENVLIMDITHIRQKFQKKYNILGLIGNNFLNQKGALINYQQMILQLIKI